MERLATFYGADNLFTAVKYWNSWQLRQPYSSVHCNTSELLEKAATSGQNILFEAQLGTLRDLNFGIYPFTTSSCTLAGYAPIGGGLFGHAIDNVIAVVKAFSTCVGEGPFVTVMDKEEGDALREFAKEYGAATGRPRTIGHFDAVATR